MKRTLRKIALVLLTSFVAGSTAFGANILFVQDGSTGTADEIPAALTAEGHTVTSVYDDYANGDNAILQGGSLSQYDAIYWHASGDAGYGAEHNPATFADLTAYVNGGGRVFVTGYDVLASPTDVNMIGFLGGSNATDGGFAGTETVGIVVNSLTTGYADITGLTLNGPGDHDGLTGLQAGTVAVATGSNGTSHGWTLRTLGNGEIAWVSSPQASGSAFAQWTTVGSGWHEALLNFVYNVGNSFTAGCGNVLFVQDGATGTADEIPAELAAAGYNVTSVYDDYTNGDNTTLQGMNLDQYDAIFWHASGSNGYGEVHNAATFTNLSTYVNNGGSVFVTGYDVIASPADPELITFLGGTSSSDGGFSGNETLTTNANSLTVGAYDITGMTVNITGDHDGLNGLQAGTEAIASTGTSHGWTIRTLGSGEIAWVSTIQFFGEAFPAWGNVGTGWHEALINFAYNATSFDVTTSLNGLDITASNSNATSYQWINCSDNSAIAGETNQTFTATANGDYAVVITEGGCTDTSACVTISTVGLTNLDLNGLIVAPNPAKDGKFKVSSDLSIEAIEVVDMLGKKMNINANTTTGDVDASALSKGKYMVIVTTETSTRTAPLVITD